MNQTPRALYELGPLGECPHVRARLECDPAVSRWYVGCLDCGAAGPTAESDQVARDGWAEMVEFVEALAVWNAINTIGVDAAGPLPDCRTSEALV